MKYTKKSSRILSGIMRLFFILLGFMNRNLFFTDMDSSRDFVIDNFSNSITKDNPAQIYFTRSEKNLSHLFCRLYRIRMHQKTTTSRPRYLTGMEMS